MPAKRSGPAERDPKATTADRSEERARAAGSTPAPPKGQAGTNTRKARPRRAGPLAWRLGC